MPQVKRVKSLQSLCIRNVVHHIDLWNKFCVDISKENRSEKLADFVGPFDLLPATFMKKLEEGLYFHSREKCPIGIDLQYIELLTTPRLNEVKLRHWKLNRRNQRKIPEAEIYRILQVISARSPTLKVLEWRNPPSSIFQPIFENFLPCFANLQVLHIASSAVGDSCLKILGAFCPDLRALGMQDCPITDNGIQALCSGVNGLGIKSLCKSLCTLNLKRTQVTKRGIQMALENFPLLNEFDFDCSVQILAELYEEAVERESPENPIPKYSLVKFECKDFKDSDGNKLPYQNESIASAALLCSSVSVADIAICSGLTDDELICLIELEKLEKLRIADKNMVDDDLTEISFNGGVIPLCVHFSSSLTSLILKNLSICINIRFIMEYCPKLEELFLECNDSYTTTWNEDLGTTSKQKKMPILQNLKSLRIGRADSSEIPTESFVHLLSSPLLTNLYIYECSHLTDEVILHAASSNQFRELVDLKFVDCPEVTKQGIDLFLKDNNPLQSIYLVDCSSLTNANFDEWKRTVFEKNWCLDTFFA